MSNLNSNRFGSLKGTLAKGLMAGSFAAAAMFAGGTAIAAVNSGPSSADKGCGGAKGCG